MTDPSSAALLLPDGALDLDAARARLEAELDSITGRHHKIRSHLHNVDREVPGDWADAAQEAENDEVLEALEESGRDRIAALQGALRRIDEGEYTTCARCGEDINPRRLVAVPTTTRCVKCADLP